MFALQSLSSLALLAEVADDTMGTGALWRHLLAAVVFAAVGIAVLFACIWIFDKIKPFSFRKEILEDQNIALGIIVGAVLLGASIIIAAAILG